MSPELARTIVDAAIHHHDSLRMQFRRQDGQWTQTIAAPAEDVPFEVVDLSDLPDGQWKTAIEQKAEDAQSTLNLQRGPILRVVMFRLGANESARLLITIHHLVIDNVSWRVLLEDLLTAFSQQRQGEMVQLPPKTTSFKRWAERLQEYAHSDACVGDLEYWAAIAKTRAPDLPVDNAAGKLSNTRSSTRTVTASLTVDETRDLLHEVPKAYHTQVNDVLLTALAQALTKWTGGRSLLVDLEGHGREEVLEGVDVSRTVGWFTTVHPLRLTLPLSAAANPGNALKSVKEQIRQVPKRGLSYGLLRYMHSDARLRQQLEAVPQPQIGFNYLGQFDQLFQENDTFGVAEESVGDAMSPRGMRRHLLEVNGGVSGGQLHLTWTYSENVHRRETIEKVTADYIAKLRNLINHCRSHEATFTPSDFGLARMSERDLNRVLTKLNGTEEREAVRGL